MLDHADDVLLQGLVPVPFNPASPWLTAVLLVETTRTRFTAVGILQDFPLGPAPAGGDEDDWVGEGAQEASWLGRTELGATAYRQLGEKGCLQSYSKYVAKML